MLELGANPNIKDNEGKTALFYHLNFEQMKFSIAFSGYGEYSNWYVYTVGLETDLRAVDALIEHGANINERDNRGRTALFDLINPDAVDELVSRGAEINAQDDEGLTPLMTAKNVHVVRAFLRNGADITIKDKKGRTALDVFKDNEEIFTVLKYPLHNSIPCKESVLKQRLSEGATLNDKDEMGNTPLHQWMNHPYDNYAYDIDSYSMNDFRHNDDILEVSQTVMTELIAAGADVNAKNNAGETPLMLAVNHPDMFSLLLKVGADPHALNHKGQNISFYMQNSEAFKQVLDTGVPMNLIDSDGRSVLMQYLIVTEYTGDWEIEKLIELGNDIHAQDNDGKTPLIYALIHERTFKSHLLSETTVNIADNEGKTPIMYACNEWEQLNLIKKGANLNIIDKQGQTVLDYAQNDPERLKQLLYPYHYIDISYKTNVFETLKDQGFDINERGPNGDTPLLNAVRNHKLEVAKWLLKSGADVTIKDIDGKTAEEIIGDEKMKALFQCTTAHDQN